MTEHSPQFAEREPEGAKRLLYQVKDSFHSILDPDDLIDVLANKKYLKKREQRQAKKLRPELKVSYLWSRLWEYSSRLSEDEIKAVFSDCTSEKNQKLYKYILSHDKQKIYSKTICHEEISNVTEDVSTETDIKQDDQSVIIDKQDDQSVIKQDDQSEIKQDDQSDAPGGSGLVPSDGLPPEAPSYWFTVQLCTTFGSYITCNGTDKFHTRGEDGEMINIVPPGRVHLYSYEHGVSLYFPQGTLQEPLLLKFSVIPLDEASSSLRAYSAVFRFQVLGDTQWTVSSGHPIWLELPHFCTPGEDQTGFSQLVFFSRSSDSEPFVANTNGVFPLGYPYGGIPLYHFSDHFIGEKVKFNDSGSAVSSTAMNNVCISLQQPSMRHWRRAWNADLLALPLVPSYLSCLHYHYKEQEWDAQMLTAALHSSDQLLICTNESPQSWDIQLPQERKLDLSKVANIRGQLESDDDDDIFLEIIINERSKRTGHLKKSQRFQTNKHQAGEVVEVAQRLCQMIKGSSTKETAKQSDTVLPFSEEVCSSKHALQWPSISIAIHRKMSDQLQTEDMSVPLILVKERGHLEMGRCYITARCLAEEMTCSKDCLLSPEIMMSPVKFFESRDQNWIDRMHCMILVDLSFQEQFSEQLMTDMCLERSDILKINSMPSSTIREKEYQMYCLCFQSKRCSTIQDLVDIFNRIGKENLVEGINDIIKKHTPTATRQAPPESSSEREKTVRVRDRKSQEMIAKVMQSTDKLLLCLKSRISPLYWKMLGRLLGLCEQDLDGIFTRVTQSKDLADEYTIQVLKCWAMFQEGFPNYSELMKAITFLSTYFNFSDALYFMLSQMLSND